MGETGRTKTALASTGTNFFEMFFCFVCEIAMGFFNVATSLVDE